MEKRVYAYSILFTAFLFSLVLFTGACQTSSTGIECFDQCTVGQYSCIDNNINGCGTASNGCLDWYVVQYCPSGSKCEYSAPNVGSYGGYICSAGSSSVACTEGASCTSGGVQGICKSGKCAI